MADFLTLQTIFKERILRIPDYQRGYSWGQKHRKDLLTDLEEVPPSKHHYTGTIVVHDTQTQENFFGVNYKVYNIVDGQQRITSLILLLNEIRKVLVELSKSISTAFNYAKNIEDNYIKVQSEVGDFYKLTLHNDNHDVYANILSDTPIGMDIEVKSHKNLLEGREQFASYLGEKEAVLQKKEDYFDWLKSLLLKITDQLRFNFYVVEEQAEVGVIFEVMNDRGKPLSQLEKVKNHLMHMAYKTTTHDTSIDFIFDKINKSWKNVFQNLLVSGRESSGDEDQLLRFHWIVTSDPNSKNYDIHQSVKSAINLRVMNNDDCYRKIQEYADSLSEISIMYRDLFLPHGDHAFSWMSDSEKKKIQDINSQIGRLGSQATVLPILIAGLAKWRDHYNELLELFRLCEVFIFRVYEVGDKRSNTGLSQAYALARKIYQGYGAKYALKDLRELIAHYVNDSWFKTVLDWKGYNFYEWDGLKYFLFELERYEVSKMGGIFTLDWSTLKNKDTKETIEHILPQTMSASWKSFFTNEEHSDNLNRLGNLTLTNWNGSLSNKSFADKKGTPGDLGSKTYQNSNLQIEKQLASYDKWTQDEIDTRTESLIKFAIERWAIV